MSEIGMQSWFRVLIIYIYHCARTKIHVHLDPRLENQEIVSKSAEENAVENQTLKRRVLKCRFGRMASLILTKSTQVLKHSFVVHFLKSLCGYFLTHRQHVLQSWK